MVVGCVMWIVLDVMERGQAEKLAHKNLMCTKLCTKKNMDYK